MINKEFNFRNFILSKGFTKIDDNNFRYNFKDNLSLLLEIINDEYLIPFASDKVFRSKLPVNEIKANQSFVIMEDLLGIKFSKIL